MLKQAAVLESTAEANSEAPTAERSEREPAAGAAGDAINALGCEVIDVKKG